MKTGGENSLWCAELLGMFSFTDKMTQKRDLTQKWLNPHEKYSKLMHYRNNAWPLEIYHGVSRVRKKQVEKMHVNYNRIKNYCEELCVKPSGNI